MPTEAQVLAHTMDRARQYTRFYFDKLKDRDLHRRFVCEGHELNSAYWLIAHIAVTQNGLLLMATGGPFEKFSWAKHFGRGGPGLPPEQCPPFTEVLETFDRIHTKAIAHVAALPDAALEGPNLTGIALIGTTVRDVVIHAIRHEGLHTGHLSWLCKLHGITTM
ncbi:MAG: DinB family protein [Flavobacteriales bacterium]|nr:DinB family protein [Flavobacteriales bacterium]